MRWTANRRICSCLLMLNVNILGCSIKNVEMFKCWLEYKECPLQFLLRDLAMQCTHFYPRNHSGFSCCLCMVLDRTKSCLKCVWQRSNRKLKKLFNAEADIRALLSNKFPFRRWNNLGRFVSNCSKSGNKECNFVRNDKISAILQQ